jgi:hypothetical protein
VTTSAGGFVVHVERFVMCLLGFASVCEVGFPSCMGHSTGLHMLLAPDVGFFAESFPADDAAVALHDSVMLVPSNTNS